MLSNQNIKQVTILWIVIVIMTASEYVCGQTIAAGGWHSLVVCEDSTVRAFGENASGQLGNYSTDDSNVPVQVMGLDGVIAVSAGGDQLEAHSMALKADGTVWCWGSNLYGALGNGTSGTNNSTQSPVQTLLLNNVKAISAGGWHSVALREDSTVWAWGWNQDGQLGDGSTTDRTIPTKVPNLNGVIQIAAGTYHTLALKSDGTVWAWGDNLYGQLGNGANLDSNTPVQVHGLNNILHIAAGRFYSLAIKADGTVWTWGQNLYGQLGDGSTSDKNIPIQVPNFKDATHIAACGAFHTVVVKNDGTAWAWGRNTYGNLGTDDVIQRNSPTPMLNNHDVAGVALGTNFTLLYKKDGTFWACGRNASGQLGDGTFTQHNILTHATGVCKILQPTIKNFHFAFHPIKVFPNPSSDGLFHLDLTTLPVSDKSFYIKITNSLGQLVFFNKCSLGSNPIFPIDLGNQLPGLYILCIETLNAKYYQKLVKD